MSVELLTGAFVAGTALTAAAGALAEARAQSPACLDRPFIDHDRIGWSLMHVLAAGPYLLAGEAAQAWRSGRCGIAVLAASIAATALWCLALGILWLELLWQIAQHLA